MKALTICQPYAELILRGVKRVENRTWRTEYRGQLLIHAGKSRSWLGDPAADYGIAIDEMQFGAVVGVAELSACVQKREIDRCDLGVSLRWLRTHEHATGPWCWVFAWVRRFPEPVPARGAQGLFDIPITL